MAALGVQLKGAVLMGHSESGFFPEEAALIDPHGIRGIISIELGTTERARKVVEGTRLFALAESLGGVESLIGHPASMTHASVPLELRKDGRRSTAETTG